MRTGKAQPEEVLSDAQGRLGSYHAKQAAHQHLAKDGQPSRLGTAPSGTNHIVVGQFGDPNPMIMRVTSTRKSSPRSQKKNDFKGTRRPPGAQVQPGAANPGSSGALQAQAYGHPAASGETQGKSQGIDGAGFPKTSHHQTNGSMNLQKLHQKNQ